MMFSKLSVCASMIATSTAARGANRKVSRPATSTSTAAVRTRANKNQLLKKRRPPVLINRGLSTADAPMAPISRSTVRRMRVAQLRDELAARGLGTQGTRPNLVDRLLGVLDMHRPSEEEALLSVKEEVIEEQLEFLLQAEAVTTPEQTTHVLRILSAPLNARRMGVQGICIGLTLLEVDSRYHLVVLPGNVQQKEADACALILGLRYALSRGVQHVVVEVEDPQLVRQFSGPQQEQNNSDELFQKARQLKESFQSFEIWQSGKRHQELMLAKATTAQQKQKQSGESEVDPIRKDAQRKDQQQQDLASEWDEFFSHVPIRKKEAQSSEPPQPQQQPQPQPHSLNNSIDPQKEYLLQFDGGARGNPGVAGAGMVLMDSSSGREIWAGWKYLGPGQTNNIAEYQALIEGLECAHKLGVRRLVAEGDSELIVKQITGVYRVKKEWLKPLHGRVKDLSADLQSFRIAAIPRAENGRADGLANLAMDERTSHSVEEL